MTKPLKAVADQVVTEDMYCFFFFFGSFFKCQHALC